MAQIRMSHTEIVRLSEQCNRLADKYAENIEETKRLLDLVENAWSGMELGEPLEQLKTSIGELNYSREMLQTLSVQLVKAADSMQNCEAQMLDTIRGLW